MKAMARILLEVKVGDIILDIPMQIKSNHRVPVVKIEDMRKHPNADTLDIISVGGYQVISKTGTFRPGDLGVYIQPDSIVPEAPQFAFLWEKTEERPVPVRRRRITVKKLRGEWSEGLLLPVSDFWPRSEQQKIF